MCGWPLGLLCSSGCPACRCLAAAKAGDHSCCMDFERGFRTASPWTGWTQLLLVCLTSSCPKRRHALCSAVHWLTHRSAILSRILSFPCSLTLGWPAGCAGECRRLEKCSVLCVTQQKHEVAFEERKDPAGQQMENRKRKTSCN